MAFKGNDIINDRFLLLRSIGRGSFGEVWLAEDQKLGLNVAIKIYIALDASGLEEFKHEFRSVYNIHHPNLLRPDYFDNIEGNPYLVMPYCPVSVGYNIGKMDEGEIWKFIKDVASGLQYLHENDIIHRDIKPDNILKDEQGNYVITDFGLSTKLRSTLRQASANKINGTNNQAGTIGYMAPELFSSKPSAVKATDIWALGATIYEIATEEMPFCGQGGVMELHGAELPELPASWSKKLNNLMTKCLSKETWDRPTAKDIADIASSQLGLNSSATKAKSLIREEECVEHTKSIAPSFSVTKSKNSLKVSEWPESNSYLVYGETKQFAVDEEEHQSIGKLILENLNVISKYVVVPVCYLLATYFFITDKMLIRDEPFTSLYKTFSSDYWISRCLLPSSFWAFALFIQFSYYFSKESTLLGCQILSLIFIGVAFYFVPGPIEWSNIRWIYPLLAMFIVTVTDELL